MEKKIIKTPASTTVKFENDICEICEANICDARLHEVADKYYIKGRRDGKTEAVESFKCLTNNLN